MRNGFLSPPMCSHMTQPTLLLFEQLPYFLAKQHARKLSPQLSSSLTWSLGESLLSTSRIPTVSWHQE